jgi:DNA-binding transcriptional ArsR family regulator
MNDITIVKVLTELGNESRLSIFRLLIKHGSEGLTVGEIGTELNIAPSTLNFHLKGLFEASLITQVKESRSIRSFANLAPLKNVLDILQLECCSEIQENDCCD